MKLSNRIKTLLILGCLTTALTACSLDEIEDFNNSYETPGVTATVNQKDSDNKSDSAASDKNSDAKSENSASPVTDDSAPVKDESTVSTGDTTKPADNTDSSDNKTAAPDTASTGTAASEAETGAGTSENTPGTETSGGNTSADDTVTAAPTPVTASANPTEAPAPTSAGSSASSDNRADYWDDSFLVWVPAFSDGTFSGQDAKGTYDFAIFSNVTASQAEGYVNKCKSAGFNNVLSSTNGDGSLFFKAKNSSDWCVSIEFKNGSLTIGSGFDDSVTDTNEVVRSLYNETMLQYIPAFSAGNYESNEKTDDESEFSYIYFSGVKENDVRNYINELKNAGYIYSPDEGDSDGIIWYMALNEEVFSCYVAYDNGIIKIGCGYGE